MAFGMIVALNIYKCAYTFPISCAFDVYGITFSIWEFP